MVKSQREALPLADSSTTPMPVLTHQACRVRGNGPALIGAVLFHHFRLSVRGRERNCTRDAMGPALSLCLCSCLCVCLCLCVCALVYVFICLRPSPPPEASFSPHLHNGRASEAVVPTLAVLCPLYLWVVHPPIANRPGGAAAVLCRHFLY